MTIIYLHEILEHQRVYDVDDKRTHNDVNIIHVFVKDGIQWGCLHIPTRSLLSSEQSEHYTEIIGGSGGGRDVIARVLRTKNVKRYTPVYIEGRVWASVHRANEYDTWVKSFGTDVQYREDLLSLGIRDEDFRYVKPNRVKGSHVNSLPITPPTPHRETYEVFVPTRTPKSLIMSLSDGWTVDMKPWFGTRESYEYALTMLRKAYPPKKSRLKGKADCSVPYTTGQASGHDGESQSKTGMRMGWYIQVL